MVELGSGIPLPAEGTSLEEVQAQAAELKAAEEAGKQSAAVGRSGTHSQVSACGAVCAADGNDRSGGRPKRCPAGGIKPRAERVNCLTKGCENLKIV